MAAGNAIILQPDAGGNYTLSTVSRGTIQRVDIVDVDLVVVTKGGERYLLPGGGISAMNDSPPHVTFSDGAISVSALLGEVGVATNLSVETVIPSSARAIDKVIDLAKEDALRKQIQTLSQKIEDQKQQLLQQKHELDQKQHQPDPPQNQDKHDVSTLTANSEGSVEKMVQDLQKIVENLHKSDYDYVAPQQYELSHNVTSPPPGVPPPISMTPIVTLFMGNVVGTTIDTTTNPGYTTYYGGGGALESTAQAQLGPRNALQFSAATITGDNGDDIIYAQGPLVGNANPAVDHSTFYSKEFSLSIAGYFTTLDDIIIKNVPTGVSIVGATDTGGGVWILPKEIVLSNDSFIMVYNTNAFTPGGNNTFDIEFDISGDTMRHVTFSSKQTFRFQYMNATDVSQVTDASLIYDQNGTIKEIYILPTLDQPNIITAGDGNDLVYGSRSNDTITLGNGNNQIIDGNGNNTITTGNGNSAIVSGDGKNIISVGDGINNITLGDGANSISTGNGSNTIITGDGKNTVAVGTGSNFITTGAGDDAITSAGGGGTFDLGAGSNTITIASADDSTNHYYLTTSGSGTNVITGGDDLYDITMGSGTNTVTIGDGTDAYNSIITTGAGTNTITTGNGRHTLTVGAGVSTITTGSGQDSITAAGGGGTINAGGGDNSITINSATGSRDSYALTTIGSGNTTIVAGDDNYTINASSGTNAIAIGSGTSIITATGAGNNTITAGNGNMTIATGSGSDIIVIGTALASISTGAGDDQITAGGGGGLIDAGSLGTKTITINSAAGSQANYTLTTSGTATTTITAGDSNYGITLGSGNNTVSIGSGTSSITATGAGLNNITTGNGAMTIAAGAGNNIITTGNGVVSIVSGNGDNTITTAGGGGTIALGNGVNGVTVTTGNYTITTGTGNDTILTGDGSNTINAGSGTNSITVGNGNNTIAAGSGNDTITTGTGNNTIRAGLGTNVIAAGSGTNTLDLSDITTSVTIILNDGSVHGSAIGTGINDDLLGISTIIGTNYGDTITLGAGTRTVYAGSGNDIIRCGSGTDTIYAGNGNNIIYGSTGAAFLYGGSGNNTFLTPRMGTYYNGTNGASLAAVTDNVAWTLSNTSATDPFANATFIPNTVNYSYSGGVATIDLVTQVQLNKIDYTNSNSSMTINLSLLYGTGSGGTAQGSTYAFTPMVGYNSINYISVGNGTNYLTPSYSDTVFVGGTGTNYFYEDATLSSQNVIIVPNGLATGGNWDYIYMGAAHETVVGTSHNLIGLQYRSSPKGIVVNLDGVSHTFTSTLYSPVIIPAYSGSNWGTNEVNSQLSWSTGDYFVPVSGTSTRIGYVYTPWSSGNNICYGPNNSFTYYGNSGVDYFYGNTNVSSSTVCMYDMSQNNDVAVGGSGFNIFYTYCYGNAYNIYVIMNKGVEAVASANGWITTAQFTKDNAVNLSYGGTAYQSFAYGYGNVTNPATNPVTRFSYFENILGLSGNEFIVGDNDGNQINARAGSNTIIAGSGINIITAIEGANTIYSTGTNNTLNFETANNAYSGTMGNYSSAATAGVEVFLNNATDTTFFSTGTGGDQAAFWGGTTYDGLQARTGASGQYSFSSVQPGIISVLNGGDYASGIANSTGNSTFNFDHVYSGAATIRGHGGNSVFLDNSGAADVSYYGGTGSDAYYLTPNQVSHVSITDGINTTTEGILRVPGWGSTSPSSVNAFGSTDPFSTTKITGINVIDVRTGLDTVSPSAMTLTLGSHSTNNTNNSTFQLSALNIQNITADATSPALYLKLDSGEHFKPAGTVDTLDISETTTLYYNSTSHTSATLIATNTHNASNYYSDVLVYNASNDAHLNIHYGSG